MIRLENVHISYNDIEVIKELSFQINDYDIYGIIGPNGAGKTTILRALTGIITPDGGRITVQGKDITKLRPHERKIAYLFETARGGSFLRLTPEEDLELYAALYNVDANKKRIKDILELVNLYNERKKKLYKFSRGMWQKLYLARVILPDFPIIILDEPWLGLDVVAQRETVEMLKKFRKMGKTIVLAAHEMPLIERSCTRIMLLKDGRKLIEGRPEELFKEVGWKYRVIINRNKGENIIYVKDIRDVIKSLKEDEIYKVDIESLSLEDVYLKLIGEEGEVG